MSKFKVGATNTRDGSEAFILEIGEHRIFGRVKSGGWFAQSWDLNGKENGDPSSEWDLLPNHEPLRAEFEEVVKWAEIFGDKLESYTRNVVIVPDEFAGKCVKVTLEVLE